MNAPLPILSAGAFAELAHMPAQHFRLAVFGAAAQVMEACADGDVGAALETHAFLADYYDEFASVFDEGASFAAQWREALARWESCAPQRLPMRALLDAGLSRLDLELLFAVGLVEEDPRFGEVFERARGPERRPTLAVLLAWWRTDEEGRDRADLVRRALLELVRAGLLEVLNPEAPRPDWILSVPHALWDALRGESPALRGLTHVKAESLGDLATYIAPASARELCARLPALLRAQPESLVIVRGPAHNGRKTLLGGLARAMGKSLLIAEPSLFEDEPRWRLFGVLCVLLDAFPVVTCELLAGETKALPELPYARMPLGLVTSRQGAWSGPEARPVVTIDLPLPDVLDRESHWRAAVHGQPAGTAQHLAGAARLSSGNIRRAAKAAAGFAALGDRANLELDDLQQACRGLQSARLETLATRLPARGSLHDLSVDQPTRDELEALASRCRVREQLAAASAAVAQGSVGVRALFAGGSGTGKTLAARLLAASLGKDLYRVDLAATVNKYLGETEKNLNNAFAAAEELDVVLLLDEGDALMANRTDVGSSHDRYANLETNFLLQRIESFDGILLVTSNAADRIDKAFSRRMDVVINFRAPDEWRRYDILRTHLAGDEIDEDYLQEIACRCVLSGGQWRNVVGHARLLALQAGRAIGAEHLQAALQREYRKSGASCPLRPRS